MLLKKSGFLVDDLVKNLTSAWHRIFSCRAFKQIDIFDVDPSEVLPTDM